MKLQFFGDSYDIVKKSLIAWLDEFGLWSAHPIFTESVKPEEAAAFSRFLGVRLLSDEQLTPQTNRAEYFAPCRTAGNLFLDPDTGVSLKAKGGSKSVNYVFGSEPPEQLSEPPLVLTEREPAAPPRLKVLPDRLLTRQLKSLDKGSFSLAEFSGKIIVVNLWASWCGPCRREVPEYEKVRKEFAEREVEFIGLTTEDPRTDSNRVRQFVRDFHFGFRLGWADRETARTLMNGREAVPQTLVIAADGRVVGHWSGYSSREGGERLRDTLKNALAEKAGSSQ